MDGRWVFRVWHAQNRPAGAPVVRSAALDSSGSRVCLGLEDGSLEEHRAIVGLHYLSSVSRLVALQEGGSLTLLDAGSLRSQPLPLKGIALATCANEEPGRAPRLAVFHRPRGARSCRLTVLLLFPAESGKLGQVAAEMELPGIASPTCPAWVGAQLVCAAGMRYCFAAPLAGGSLRQLFDVPPELAYVPPRAVGLPSLAQAVVLLGETGIRINPAGHPVGDALSLEGYGALRALSGVGRHLLVWTPERLCVLEADTGACPVPAWDQVRDALAHGEAEAALRLSSRGEARGEAWAQAGLALVGLALLRGARFTEGLAVLDRVACHAFQPAQLLRLWPQRMASWLPLLEALDRATRHGDPGDVMGADPPDAGLPSPFAATGGGWQGLPVLEDGRDAKRARRGVEQEQLREAVEAFVPYFFRAREMEGAQAKDGIDTLILHLLMDLGAEDEAAAFAAVPNAAALPEAAALAALPWVLARGWEPGLRLLTRRALPVDLVLGALPEGGRVRWRFLRHLVHCGGEAAGEESVHTALALELLGLLRRGGREGGEGGHRVVLAGAVADGQEIEEGSVAGKEGTELGEPDEAELEEVAAALSQHLGQSTLCDPRRVLHALQGLGLDREEVAMHRLAGNHMEALRLLCVRLRDVPAAAAYARRHLPRDLHPDLLGVVLAGGAPTRHRDAARLVAALGLDPLGLVAALPGDAALCTLGDLLAGLVAERRHRARAAGLRRAALQARLTAARSRLAALEGGRVVVTEGTVCARSGARIGTRVFTVRAEPPEGGPGLRPVSLNHAD
ncbi:hypothetical protein F751_6592 [Auxenochlorella protothecoides]|uniref:CNH domain-containing protein n=2 Tax=Auxenochlorella protothecoides TaxID=3075 RepID=A0A087SPF7_AUXPR|nr:hypothetical protein F751_6592 [Auxenochlorella protothecoides]KFM27611.1 hypothetical protein F751_6592 [Auxenochlorella protothecoides]